MGLDNPLHILFLLMIVLLVFGAKRLPEIGRSLGSGMRGFKDSLTAVGGPAEIGPPVQAHTSPQNAQQNAQGLSEPLPAAPTGVGAASTPGRG